jgi:hypothetical protein
MSTPEHYDSEDAQEPTPEEYGFPANASMAQRQCWFRQERFLEVFAKCGKIGKAAQAVGISRACVEKWQGRDLYGFEKRMETAHACYVELLEEQMDKTVETKPAQTQILQIFRLKAEHPEKYREDIKVINADAPFQMLDRLKELAAQNRQRQQAELEAPSVEGVYREVPPGQEQQAPQRPPGNPDVERR